MGEEGADLSLEQGAETLVWLAMLDDEPYWCIFPQQNAN
jgi:hypothetical protein